MERSFEVVGKLFEKRIFRIALDLFLVSIFIAILPEILKNLLKLCPPPELVKPYMDFLFSLSKTAGYVATGALIFLIAGIFRTRRALQIEIRTKNEPGAGR